MVTIKHNSLVDEQGNVHLEEWLQHIAAHYSKADLQTLRKATQLAQVTGTHFTTPNGVPCLQQSLAMAEILMDLSLDIETLAAAIAYNSVQYTELSLEDVQEHLGKKVTKLITGTQQMDAIHALPSHSKTHIRLHNTIDNLRKMLLTMVDDMRVVFIKLAERLCILRYPITFNEADKYQLAKETMDIYAPLANRLGVGYLKWQLEDLSFHYLEPTSYKHISQALSGRRIDREKYVQQVITELTVAIKTTGIKNINISGRAKHIYSIHRKMQRKQVDITEIYDVSAVRVLVDTLEDCYAVLSIVHNLWEPIKKEFDDYIATPKPNGYRSIHTAVIGPNKQNVEIQIRTYEMHEESELGVAAHWKYKEGIKRQSGFEQKIAWLRQVLAWEKEVTKKEKDAAKIQHEIFDDRVYVFTPKGDVVDLPIGATPLDLAYYIHSELGHQCRGAKVNGAIVPLTYQLKTGEQIEILIAKQGHPSRDWLIPQLGYLTTARARAKVHHWFRQVDYEKDVILGQTQLEKELRQFDKKAQINLKQLAKKFNYKTVEDLYAAIGHGDFNTQTAIHAIEKEFPAPEPDITVIESSPIEFEHSGQDIHIEGVGHLLTHVAHCCKPVPGDAIMGYITQGQGISIHRKDCNNLLQNAKLKHERIINVSWGNITKDKYSLDLIIEAYDRHGLVRDITQLLTNEHVALIGLTCTVNKKEQIAYINITVQIENINFLGKIISKLQQIPDVVSVKRNS